MRHMCVYPGNVETFRKRAEEGLVCGFASGGQLLVLEYRSELSRRRRTLLADLTVKAVYHECSAVKEGRRSCWHLGAVAAASGWSLPQDVHVWPERALPAAPWRDVTPDVLGRPGDFELVPVMKPSEEDGEAEEVPAWDLPEEDAWLASYRLPAAVLEKLLRFREEQRARLTPEQLGRVPPPGRYVPSGKEFVFAVSALLYGEGGKDWEAPLLVGPKGSGKSTLADTLASALLLPVSRVYGGLDVNAEWLLGTRTLEPVEGLDLLTEARLRAAAKAAGVDLADVFARLGQASLRVAFEPGVLLRAVRAGEMVVVEEVNMLAPEVTSLLHGLLDWQRALSVPGLGEVKAPLAFRLVACMNPGYAGTRELNEAFQDRFRAVQVPHLSSEGLKALIVRETGCLEEVAAGLAELFSRLASRAENGDLPERVVSVRALFRAAREHMDGLGSLREVAASALTEGLADRWARDQVRDLVEACLG